MNRYAVMIAIGVFVIGLVLSLVYFHGEARYKAGYSKAREETATQVADMAKQHGIELAAAIEKTRKQEIAFHAKLKNLQTVQDTTGCLDRPQPEFTTRLRDAYPGQRGSSTDPVRSGPLARWRQYTAPDR